ncbi:MAG: beta-ketoacyl-ACP synthase II [Chloroflexi bacterium]|nr:beta-ketoacyl-ACP synthase II [Chloroflexota bacterium]
MNPVKRVVITGVGAISALGHDVRGTWNGMISGLSGAARISSYDPSDLPTQIAATIKDFDPFKYLSRREVRRLGRVTHLAMASTEEALADAKLDLNSEDPTRMGIELGSAFGAMDIVEQESEKIRTKGPRGINPAVAPAVLVSTTPCHLAIRYGVQGPVNSPVAACATGVFSLGEAARRIQRGDADVMIAGGADSYLTPLIMAAFSRLGAMTTRNNEPKTACRPFDNERDGMIIGEGSVTMILESLEHALARGARILAEFGGMGFTSDAYHMASPDPEGGGAARAMRQALHNANLTPEDIGYVAAHGTGTRLNDTSETKAIKKSLGEYAYNIPVSSIKPMIGHVMGAAGAFGALVVLQAIRTGWIPPTINYSVPDPDCDLDYVPNQARQVRINAGIANAFGFGGQNGSIVLKRFAT